MFKKNANTNKVAAVAAVGEPVQIKGYQPNGSTQMFVFRAAAKKLYASRLDCCDKSYDIRCGIATVEVADNLEALYGPRVILVDKQFAGYNNFMSRKKLLALIEIENQRYAGSTITLQANVREDQIVDDPRIIGLQESLLGAAQIYGHSAMKNGVMDSTAMLLDGLKKPSKALHKAYKKGTVIPHVQATCTPEEQEIIDDLFEDLSDEEIEEIIGEDVQPELTDADAQVEAPAPAPSAPKAPQQTKPQPKKNKQNKGKK